MKGRRSLTDSEERRLIDVARTLPARDRALITTQLFTGFRIAEVLSLKVGQVLRLGKIVPQIGVAPRHLKGRRGVTRWVPVCPELQRALEVLIGSLREELGGEPPATAPLFRRAWAEEPVAPLSKPQALTIMKEAFAAAAIRDDGRLGTHTLRKTFARKVYALSGHDIHVARAALGHSCISVTERYLECSPREVSRLVRGCDWTRRPRRPQVER